VELLSRFISSKRVGKIQRLLKRHLDAFARLRDTQVQLVAVENLCLLFPSARPFYNSLIERERHFSKEACREVKRIRPRPLAKLVKAGTAELKRQRQKLSGKASAAVLFRTVNSAFDRVSRLRGKIDPRDTRTIHRTRIAFKKFRYMVELLGNELISLEDKRLDEMQHYQTMMGDVQDAEVLLRSLDKFIGRNQSHAASLLKFREELVRRRAWLIRVYLDAAGQLKDFWPVPGLQTD
jgi:CHAD domain-containing protein